MFTYDERMVNHLQNDLFILDMINMLTRDDVVLLHRLQSELLGLVFLQRSDLDVTEGT